MYNQSVRSILQNIGLNRVTAFVQKRASHCVISRVSSVFSGSCGTRTGLLHKYYNRSSYHHFLGLLSCRSFSSSMPPIDGPGEAVQQIDNAVKSNKVCIFSKTYCPYCTKVKGLFDDLRTPYFAVELDNLDENDAALLQDALKQRTGMSTVPNVFVNGQHIGGCDDTFRFHEQNKLVPLLGIDQEVNPYQYDLIVIGGGSGGLAASKEAAKLGKKVAVCDFVKPSPIGTTWGLGGTCVNVGCIPKKLMHQGALLGYAVDDAASFGWEIPTPRTHNWGSLVQNVQDHIKSSNWGYRVALRDGKVTYLNEFAEFVDDHTLLTINKKGVQQKITSKNFLIAVGGRPRYPDIPGAREYGITSDDLFSLPYNPGKVLFVGASYISLECAGFMAGFGFDTTVMVRSILLRGFDQQVAELIGEYMEGHNVKFLRGWVPVGVEKIEEGTPPRLLVKYKSTETGETKTEEFNTVVWAIGRDPCTPDLKLDQVGVQLSKGGKIITNPADQSSVEHIYAIGDVAEGRPELTPVAIQAGLLLARRLYGGQTLLTEYDKVPTTVFTPIEYGCIGLSEEDAIAKYGASNIEVYHTFFQPTELTLPKRDHNKCYAKLVCNKADNERVLGFHYLGPNAGEVTQGFALGFIFNATKADFDRIIGLHPTCADIFIQMSITKSSGADPMKKGCCG